MPEIFYSLSVNKPPKLSFWKGRIEPLFIPPLNRAPEWSKFEDSSFVEIR